MGLYTREQHEFDIKQLARRQAILNKLLITCIYCDELFESLPGVLEGEVVEEIFRGRASIVCGGCGQPRRSAIDATQHRTISQEIERSIKSADGKLVGTALRITETKSMQKGGWFAWVIGAKQEHIPGCAKLRDEQYCSCNGLWRQTRNKGVLIKFRGRMFRDGNIQEIEALQAKGVTVIEYHAPADRAKKEPLEEPESYIPVWIQVPIAELKAYQDAGREYTQEVADREGRVSTQKFWEPRWMIRFNGPQGVAVYFEATEVGNGEEESSSSGSTKTTGRPVEGSSDGDSRGHQQGESGE